MTAGQRRLFIALELPAAARTALARWAAEAVGAIAGVRVIAEADLHVTLAFLGWRPPADVAEAERIVAGLGGPAPQLAPSGMAWLPPRRPRLAAVDLDDLAGAAGALHARVAAEVAERLGIAPDPRPFRPHVTVARLGRSQRPPRGPALAPPNLPAFRAPAASLFESHLGPGGARYGVLARQPLGGA